MFAIGCVILLKIMGMAVPCSSFTEQQGGGCVGIMTIACHAGQIGNIWFVVGRIICQKQSLWHGDRTGTQPSPSPEAVRRDRGIHPALKTQRGGEPRLGAGGLLPPSPSSAQRNVTRVTSSYNTSPRSVRGRRRGRWQPAANSDTIVHQTTGT